MPMHLRDADYLWKYHERIGEMFRLREYWRSAPPGPADAHKLTARDYYEMWWSVAADLRSEISPAWLEDVVWGWFREDEPTVAAEVEAIVGCLLDPAFRITDPDWDGVEYPIVRRLARHHRRLGRALAERTHDQRWIDGAVTHAWNREA